VQKWNNRKKPNKLRATLQLSIKPNELHVQQWNNRKKPNKLRATMY
jgi:hypothetical protein